MRRVSLEPSGRGPGGRKFKSCLPDSTKGPANAGLSSFLGGSRGGRTGNKRGKSSAGRGRVSPAPRLNGGEAVPRQGHIYINWGSYYGRWRGLDGRLVNLQDRQGPRPGREGGASAGPTLSEDCGGSMEAERLRPPPNSRNGPSPLMKSQTSCGSASRSKGRGCRACRNADQPPAVLAGVGSGVSRTARGRGRTGTGHHAHQGRSGADGHDCPDRRGPHRLRRAADGVAWHGGDPERLCRSVRGTRSYSPVAQVAGYSSCPRARPTGSPAMPSSRCGAPCRRRPRTSASVRR